MELGKRLAHALERATFERVAAVGLANAELNRPRIGRSILELADTASGGTALVIGAGPSLHGRRSLARLAAHGFAGTVVAAGWKFILAAKRELTGWSAMSNRVALALPTTILGKRCGMYPGA